MTDYKARWRVNTRIWAIEQLGGKCTRCEASEWLEFDHIDPATKSFDISAGIRDGYGKKRLLPELEKCQLLCIPHHLEKTTATALANRRHGSWGMYKNGQCRCEVCRDFVNAYMRSYKASRR